MTTVDLEAVSNRYALARLAGQDADEAGHGWDGAKRRVLAASWQDVAPLHDEVRRLRQELDEARAEIVRLQEHEQTRAQVIADHQGRLIAARDIAAERDRMRPVVKAAKAWRDSFAGEAQDHPRNGLALQRAVDTYRSSTPDAEPAPGVPVDTEATP